MGRNDVKEKLSLALKKVSNEHDVVFIMSRVRKLIEDDSNRDSDARLKFYCNWALHMELEYTNNIKSILESDNTEERLRFEKLEDFEVEFKAFINRHELTIDDDMMSTLKQEYSKIISDASLIYNSPIKYEPTALNSDANGRFFNLVKS